MGEIILKYIVKSKQVNYGFSCNQYNNNYDKYLLSSYKVIISNFLSFIYAHKLNYFLL